MQTSKLMLIAILIALCVPPMICAENIPGLNVSYDTKNDRLTVDAKSVPLTQILAQISEQSGVEILVDPSVEKELSIYLPAQPLKKALKQLARGLNYAMYYNDEDSRLVAMKIVPKGKQVNGNLVSVTKSNARTGGNDGYSDENNVAISGVGTGLYTTGDSYGSENQTALPSVNRGQPYTPEKIEQQNIDASSPGPQKP
jgi:type II secretory pathway component GspD/PulD (secretin)